MTTKNCWRSFQVERASVNGSTGEFRGVLFTDGEANDGHILNVSGGQIPERMPLFINHAADPRTQPGSLYFDRRTEHQIHVRGQILLDGEGAEADIRRDIVRKMAAGHVSALSGRWDYEDGDVKYRTDLPQDHPAHVSEKRARSNPRLRAGLYFEKWRAMEGSIVGLGADPVATMRWAEEAESEAVRSFYRGIAEQAEDAEDANDGQDEEVIPVDQDPPVRMSDLEASVIDPLVEKFDTLLKPLRERIDALESPRAEQAPAEAEAERLEEPAQDQPARESLPTVRKKWDPGEVAVAITQAAERHDRALLAELESLVRREQGKV